MGLLWWFRDDDGMAVDGRLRLFLGSDCGVYGVSEMGRC